MKVAYAQAQPRRGLKAAIRCVHPYGWWSERIIWCEHESAPVLATFVRRIRCARDYVVPF